jgi:phospholipase C
VSISASPATVPANSSSMLGVATTGATTVTVKGSDGSSYTMPGTGGSQAVTVTATTTYTATATGAGGTSAPATATVTVSASAPPTASAPTVAIAATPASISASDSSKLVVTATNATRIVVTGADKSSYTLPGTGGTVPVSPNTTTAYTATATGSGGTASATATVTVTDIPLPAISIKASPSSITQSSSSTITVTAMNSTGVVLTGSDNSSYTLSSTGGTQAVSPATTTTYTATSTGPGGQSTGMVTVNVTPNPPPSLNFEASPTSITTGGTAFLSVQAMNATDVTISGTDGSSYTLPSTNATQNVQPTTTTTYTATATGPGGHTTAIATVTVTALPAPTAAIIASPSTVVTGNSSTLAVTATNATTVTLTGTDGSSFTIPDTGGSQIVTPTTTTTYTVTASGKGGHTTAATTVTVTSAAGVKSIDHVVLMLQENHSFDSYFGMLNPYRVQKGWNVGADGSTYTVDGIDDKLATTNEDDEGVSFPLFKLATTCVDDETSSWLESYGQVNRYDFSPTRAMNMDGFIHTAEDFAKYCQASGGTQCAGTFTDFTGQRAMGYYDQDFLNYYYYMASQFALSDRWFTPISSKSIDNRIATYTGGTTQGLVFDPGNDDHLSQLEIEPIFQELDSANVSWKIYYTVTQGACLSEDDCPQSASARYPATDFSSLSYSYKYLYIPQNPGQCTGTTQPSSVVGDTSNSFCIDPNHIAPIAQYYTDLANNTLPSFAFIEAGYGINDEHPGSGQSILAGQAEVASILNAFMTSPSWKDSVFFLAYDEAGGPYDHVPPVQGHSNDKTDAVLGSEAVGSIPDISTIAVNADSYLPCLPTTVGKPTLHCDLTTSDPGANSGDAAAISGFAAQLGFRVPNMVISPFTKKHYVSHIPMDHTAILKFVENRFIGPQAHLTARDAAQPNLLDFFDFTNPPWEAPPTPPMPFASTTSCQPQNMTPATGANP